MQLSRCRPVAVGMSGAIFLPVLVSEAIAMAQVIGWDPIDFLRVIGPGDTLYVDQLNQRNAAKNKNGPRSPRNSN